MSTGRLLTERFSLLASRAGVLASALLTSALLTSVALSGAALSSGCASGGGGGGEDDASTTGRDASVQPMTDAGTTAPHDSGMMSTRDGGGTTPRDSGTPPPDTGPACSESPCRLVGPQCGCPVAQACYVDNTGTRGCARAGAAGEGQACGAGDNCQPGHLCVGATGSAFCSRFCETDADCTGGVDSICLFTLNDGAGGSVPGVKLCTNDCNPVTSAGCPSGMGCGLYQEQEGLMRDFTSCRDAGSSTTYQPCASSDDCAPGHFCGDAGAGNECIRFCRLPGGTECSSFEACNPFDPAPIIDGAELGFCY